MATIRSVEPLSPQWQFYLMTGRYPETRVRGWVEMAQALNPRVDHGPVIADVWRRHRLTLLAEATRWNFRPWAETGIEPSGPAVDAWAAQFEATHR